MLVVTHKNVGKFLNALFPFTILKFLRFVEGNIRKVICVDLASNELPECVKAMGTLVFILTAYSFIPSAGSAIYHDRLFLCKSN